MATTSNSTLKGVLVFGALTIGAAMFFVGSEDDAGVLAAAAENNASNSNYDEDSGTGLGSNASPSEMRDETESSEPMDQDAVEWGDEDFIDSAQGTDPTPSPDETFGDYANEDAANASDEAGFSDNIPTEAEPRSSDGLVSLKDAPISNIH